MTGGRRLGPGPTVTVTAGRGGKVPVAESAAAWGRRATRPGPASPPYLGHQRGRTRPPSRPRQPKPPAAGPRRPRLPVLSGRWPSWPGPVTALPVVGVRPRISESAFQARIPQPGRAVLRPAGVVRRLCRGWPGGRPGAGPRGPGPAFRAGRSVAATGLGQRCLFEAEVGEGRVSSDN